MNSMESQLRDAYEAAAQTVRPETAPAPPAIPALAPAGPGRGRGWRTHAPRLTGRPARIGVALAAAAAVTAITLTATFVSRVWAGQPGQTQPSSATGTAILRGKVAPGVPRYLVAIVDSQHSDATTLAVYDSRTGRVVSQLARPAPGLVFQKVAAVGGDNSFVVTANHFQAANRPRPCSTWLYQVRLTAQGRLGPLRPFTVPRVAGVAEHIAGSTDGHLVALAGGSCSAAHYVGHLDLISTATGQTTAWTYRTSGLPVALSLTADGRLAGFVGERDNRKIWTVAAQRLGSLRTTARPGPLQQRARTATAPVNVLSSVLSPSGRVTYALTYKNRDITQSQVRLAVYRTSNGKLLRVLRNLPWQRGLNLSLSVSVSASGRYLLLYGWNGQVERFDVASGRMVTLPVLWGDRLLYDVAW